MVKQAPKQIPDQSEFESNSRYKLSPISHAYRVQFARDMKKLLERLSVTIERHREAHKANPTDHSRNQLAYFKAQRAGVKMLMVINEQRRGLNATR